MTPSARPWAVPEYSRTRVDRAGELLILLLDDQLNARNRLSDYKNVTLLVEREDFLGPEPHYLLELDPYSRNLTVTEYKRRELPLAVNDYSTSEAKSGVTDVVLVSTRNIQALKRAYPNYFGDTQIFLRELGKFLG